MEVQRTIPVDASRIFALFRDPKGHVAIDSSGMLQDSSGEPASKAGDEFVVHMDRESLNDYPMGKYDVTVTITDVRARSRDCLDDPRPDPAADRPRLRLHARACRRGHARDVLLRLVGHRPAVEGREHLPRHFRDRTARHARDPRSHAGPFEPLVSGRVPRGAVRSAAVGAAAQHREVVWINGEAEARARLRGQTVEHGLGDLNQAPTLFAHEVTVH